MKTKWIIIIGVVVTLFAVLVIMYLKVGSRLPQYREEDEKLTSKERGDELDRLLLDEAPRVEEKWSDEFRASIERRDAVDRLLDEMEFGVIAFNMPTHINIKDSAQIQLLLSLADTVEKLKQSITEAGEKVGATIRVSDRMEARLSGYMFQITAITPETQAVSKIQETEWKWEIHPKEEGKHKLHLTLTALLEIDGHSAPRAIRTFDKEIEVTVTNIQKIGIFFNNNWKWLWAVILGPGGGLGWLWWLWKRKKTANKAN